MAAITYPVGSGASKTMQAIGSPGVGSGKIWYESQVYNTYSGRDDTEGNPTSSLRVGGSFSYKFRVAVPAGDRTFAVSAKQPLSGEARPMLIVHANPDVGLNSSLVASAPAGSGWVTTDTLSFTATANGGVVVELRNPAGSRVCWFDNLSLT